MVLPVQSGVQTKTGIILCKQAELTSVKCVVQS